MHRSLRVKKVNKTIGLLRKLQNNLLWAPLLAVYKLFIKPHLDYDDILYDQTLNNFFHEKLESIEDNGVIAITVAKRGNSREKPYQELGFESLQQRRWYRKLCLNFQKNQSPFDLKLTAWQAYMTKHKTSISCFNVKHDYFKNPFFPSTIIDELT